MSYILESLQKSRKTDWRGKKIITSVLNSSVNEKGRVELENTVPETSLRTEKKSNNSSVREQIFHPVDRIF